MLSNYNIKYICTIYTRLDTCLMHISRFSLRDKERLRLLKLYFYIADVVEWSRALDIRLSDWCCSVSMVWVQRSNSNTVWFNFQTYAIFSINLVSQVSLRSSGTDILYGCHLIRCFSIIFDMLFCKWSFPLCWLITGFVTRLTRRVLLVEQELLTLPVHPRFLVGFVLLDLQLYVYVL